MSTPLTTPRMPLITTVLSGLGSRDNWFPNCAATNWRIPHWCSPADARPRDSRQGRSRDTDGTLDALPRPGETEPRLSGTVSQAWNLAEFVRNVYDDYLGIRIERLTHRIVLRPHIPRALGIVQTSFRIDGRILGITAGKIDDTVSVTMSFPHLDRPYAVEVILPNDRGEEFSTSFALSATGEVAVRAARHAILRLLA